MSRNVVLDEETLCIVECARLVGDRDTWDICRRHLQREFEANRERTRLLAEYHNSFTIFLGRIPTELLSEIIHIHVDLHFLSLKPTTRSQTISRDFRGISSSREHYGWISIAHVCRHLRALVLGDVMLWSDILLTRREPTRDRLDLVPHHTPLYIRATPTTKVDCLQHVFDDSRPVRGMDMQLSPTGLSFLHTVTAVDLQYLHSVRLSVSAKSPPEQLPRFLDDSIPCLTSLSLSGFDPRVLSRYTGTSLRLKNFDLSMSWYGDAKSCPFNIFEVLESTPVLEYLRLRNVFQWLPKATPQSSCVVPLLRLRALDMVEDASACTTFFQKIKFSRSLDYLYLVAWDEDATETEALLHALASSNSFPHLRSLSLSSGLDDELEWPFITGWSDVVDVDKQWIPDEDNIYPDATEEDGQSPPAHYKVTLDEYSMPSDSLHTLVSTLPMSHVQTLRLAVEFPDDYDEEWLEIFSNMPLVEQLCLRGPDIHLLPTILQSTTIFPSLKSIYLENCLLDPDLDDNELRMHGYMNVPEFLSGLAFRKEQGMGVGLLKVYGVGGWYSKDIPESLRDRLSHLVTTCVFE